MTGVQTCALPIWEVFYKSLGENGTQRIPDEYLKKVEIIMKRVKQINDNKRPFPVWGTCLGYEAILITDSNYTLMRHDVDNQLRAPDRIVIGNSNTRFAKFFTPDEMEKMNTTKLFYFNHKYGLFQKEVQQNEYVGKNINTIAHITKLNQPVLVWFEYKQYPIIGIQFHPEKFKKLRDSKKGTPEYDVYHISRKFAIALKSFVTNPDIYLNHFKPERLKENDPQNEDILNDGKSRFLDNKILIPGDDQFTMENIGGYEKIEVFVGSKDKSD